MNEETKATLSKVAGAIRQLSIEAVQKANSGHPGLPLGCAEFGAYLYGHLMQYNPNNPNWLNRDRFVLSAGHGSMLLYSCLHLAGFDLSIDEIKNFRQLHSKTPGHPEYHITPGVESTTGPLGQGVGNAIGQAFGLKILEERFNKPSHEIFNAKVFCLAGDGCMMEGVSQEASSLAGHLGLNNMVLIHDANKISLDGPLSQSSSENTPERYRSYGWDVYECDGNNLDELDEVFSAIREHQERPVFISMRTVIGKGSPNLAGTHKVHGAPLGDDELQATKKALGLPEEPFFVPQSVYAHFEQRAAKMQELEEGWRKDYEAWKSAHPDLAGEFEQMRERTLPKNLREVLEAVEITCPEAGRKMSQAVLGEIGKQLPYLYGGSADLSVSDNTMMKQFPLIGPGDFSGRNIKYGVREFAMATIAAGLYQSDMIVPFIGTFLTFSDYMRNAVRLAALSHYRVIYQFTHDSIMMGEDGPTHQAVEHLASLRAMPNIQVHRPADGLEVKAAWLTMLEYDGPSAIVLSRQKLPEVSGTSIDGALRGGYIVKKEAGDAPDFTLFATGSELSLALEVAHALGKMSKQVRVVSMPCWEVFEMQSQEYQNSVLGEALGKRVSIEAAVSMGWERFIGSDGIAICMEGFGDSAPMADLQKEHGFTVEAVLERILP